MVKKDLNFLPRKIIDARKKKKLKILLILTGILLFTGLGGAICYPYRAASQLQDEIEIVKSKINDLKPAKPYYKEKEELKHVLRQKQEAVDNIKDLQWDVTGVLKKINSIMPQECYVTYLAVRNNEDLMIEVATHNPLETARVQVGLRRLGLFERVNLADVGKIPLRQEASRVRFNLKFTNDIKDKVTHSGNSLNNIPEYEEIKDSEVLK
ncbi:MAG: hypothetical protein K9L17_00340 [Clostridiales bacterium]|nr:hypothetical protein [Clostridiales bacterium]MCF8021139.1 hypothetical protein [Clostridiales bacterium]